MAAAGEAALAPLVLLAFVFAAAAVKFPVFLLPSTPADLAPLKGDGKW